jgi:Kef-type K+ transport system membrane component KefB
VPGYSLLIVAGLGGLAIVLSKIVHRYVPEIIVFLALGVLIGPDGPLALINADNLQVLDLLTEIALAAIIFLIGDRLRIDDLRAMKRLLLPLNVTQIVATGLLVFVAVRAVGVPVQIAAVLGLIGAETGVLTVTATIKQERAAGRLTDVVLSSVALTNVAVAALFGITFPFILAASGEATSTGETLQVFAQIVVASSAIGLLAGLILRTYGAAIETSGELLLLLLLMFTGMTGAAIAVDGSVVVTALVAGLFVANATPWLADRFFAAIRTLEAPIYLIFFIVAGADINLDELASVGVIGAAYVVARAVGKVGGSAIGVLPAGMGELRLGARTGLALLPHAGMAIALTAFVSEFAPELGSQVSPIVLGSIVVFELSGPLLARRVLRSTGDAGNAGTRAKSELELAAIRTLRKVLIPVGNRTVLVPRLPFLLDLVSGLGAEVVAVHVAYPSIDDEDDEPEVLAMFREVADSRGIACTTVQRRSEAVASVIVDVAEREGVDLIVMGEPARTTLLEPTRWGLISQRVVRDAPMPVLVYPVDPSNPEQVPDMYLRPPAQVPADGDGDDASGSTASGTTGTNRPGRHEPAVIPERRDRRWR